MADKTYKLTFKLSNGELKEVQFTVPEGEPGDTPYIGDNGNWYIGETDTGVKAEGKDGKDGTDGKSAYQYALDGGYTGTEEEFAQKLAQETSGSGIHIGTDAPTDENVNVWIDTDEEAEPVNPGGGSVPAAQSDWDAAEGQPGHVLNRTHYKGYETVFPETEIALNEDGTFEVEYESVRYPMDDCVYCITWNGVAYKCQPVFVDGMLCLGDIDGDGSYPFLVAWMNMEADGVFSVYMVVDSNDLVEKVTVGIEKEVYVKIPFEYLPETVKTYTVKIPEGEVDLEATNWDLSESGDKAAETLYHGGRVFLDIPNSSAVVRTELTYYSILLYPDEGLSMLIGSCLQGKRVINVTFARGTWMPPTA